MLLDAASPGCFDHPPMVSPLHEERMSRAEFRLVCSGFTAPQPLSRLGRGRQGLSFWWSDRHRGLHAAAVTLARRLLPLGVDVADAAPPGAVDQL